MIEHCDIFVQGAPVERPFLRESISNELEKGWVLLLHGLMGSRRNLRQLARSLSKLSGRVVVVFDMPGHGSHPAQAPLDLEQCAQACVTLGEELECEPSILIGHSLGGKVALLYLRKYASELTQLFVLDAYPGTLELSEDKLGVQKVIDVAEAVSLSGGRRHIIKRMVQMGLTSGTAAWLATNIRMSDDSTGLHRWKISFQNMRAVLESYANLDTWDDLLNQHEGMEVFLIRAGRDSRWGPDEISRIHRGAEHNKHFHDMVIESSGHWLHIDAPEQLLNLLLEGIGDGR